MSGLDGVVEDGAVVVASFAPRQLDGGVPDLLHLQNTGRAGHAWGASGG